MEEGAAPEQRVIKAMAMLVPESVLEHAAEKKRIKKGLLSDSEERPVFEKTLYLPYLDFTYQYPAERGLFSRQTTLGQGRSVMMALREVELGFYPEMASLSPHLVDVESESQSVIQGVESTVLVSERLEQLKKMLSEYDNRLRELSRQYNSLFKTDRARDELKETIDHLKKTRETRWKMFADGLKLPSKIDLEKIELLEGNLFYMPYFVVHLSRRGESRFLVWDREGKENDIIVDELTKNGRFRDLVQSYATAETTSGSEGNRP